MESTRHQSITSTQNDLAEAMDTYAQKINAIVDGGDVMSPKATANILNAVSNLVVAQNLALDTMLAAIGALARDAGRRDIAVSDGGFETP